eukprot:scaffold1733_cov123-Isochrysis_galbana.AAC.4
MCGLRRENSPLSPSPYRRAITGTGARGVSQQPATLRAQMSAERSSGGAATPEGVFAALTSLFGSELLPLRTDSQSSSQASMCADIVQADLQARVRARNRTCVELSSSPTTRARLAFGTNVQGRVRLCRLGTRAAGRHRDPPRARGVLLSKEGGERRGIGDLGESE